MKTAAKITAIAVAFPAMCCGWALGLLACSFAWQTIGSTGYLAATAVAGVLLASRFG